MHKWNIAAVSPKVLLGLRRLCYRSSREDHDQEVAREADSAIEGRLARLLAQESHAIANGIRRYRADAAIIRVKDGEQTVRFLFHHPDLVVLARDLPTVPSQTVIARLRQHSRTQMTPVLVVWRGPKDGDVDEVLEDQRLFERQQSILIVDGETLERRLCGLVTRPQR